MATDYTIIIMDNFNWTFDKLTKDQIIKLIPNYIPNCRVVASEVYGVIIMSTTNCSLSMQEELELAGIKYDAMYEILDGRSCITEVT